MAMPPIRPLSTILYEHRKFQIQNTILQKWSITDRGIIFCAQDLTTPSKRKNTDLVVNLIWRINVTTTIFGSEHCRIYWK
jgi:hypothetical protein